MRAIWSGAIGFGLINIPIKMYSAVQSDDIDLDMLDKHDNANIKYQRINEKTGEEVAYGDIVKGFKTDKGYVVLNEDDFEAASPKKSQVVELEEFVDEDEIEAAYYETPYFLEPQKGAGKAFLLLRDALDKTGKVAVGSYVMRGKEHLCALKAYENTIMLLRLRFAEEIRSTDELNIPAKATFKPKELQMATHLIEALTPKKFSLAKYKDTYHASLLKIIKQKEKGKKPKQPSFKVVASKSKDLMAQLKASLEEKQGKKKKAA